MTEPERPGGTDGSSGHAVLPTHTITIPPDVPMVSLLGPRDELLATVERAFPSVDVHVRGNELSLRGPSGDVVLLERLVDELLVILAAGQALNRDAVEQSIGMLRSHSAERPADVLTLNIISSRGRTIRPKTLGQKGYVDAIDGHTVVFGIGPAGTGKTYLAMAKAVAALQTKRVNRIILTRPAVEAGERLGFLPGTLSDKIDPYLRPLYDALHDMIDPESIPRLMAAGTIEVAPLAYMRGRAQPYDTQALTPEGFRRFGDLEVGDLVVGSDGRPTPVIGVHPQGRKQVYRLTTQDGASTLCCGEHLWTVRTPDDERRGRWRTVETRDMVGRLRDGNARVFELPLVEPVELVPHDVPMDPYALGRSLGDGCRTSVTTPALAMADPVSREPRPGRAGSPSARMFVPAAYLHNAPAVRLAVLQGLLDAEGALRPHAGRTSPVQYATASARLRDDVVFLVRSLGGVADARTPSPDGRRRGTSGRRDVQDRGDGYVVDIRLPLSCPPFRFGSTQAGDEAGRPRRYVDRIEPAGVQETMCIQVAAPDSLYVTDDFILTHNTLNDAFIILDEAQNTSSEQMKMFLTRLGFGSKMVITGDVTQVDLPGGVRSGLRHVRDILRDVPDVHFTELTSSDVVRHRLVSAIVDAYGHAEALEEARPPARRATRHTSAGTGPR
jgi:phosphate starvation-inducible PhoH-like protein